MERSFNLNLERIMKNMDPKKKAELMALMGMGGKALGMGPGAQAAPIRQGGLLPEDPRRRFLGMDPVPTTQPYGNKIIGGGLTPVPTTVPYGVKGDGYYLGQPDPAMPPSAVAAPMAVGGMPNMPSAKAAASGVMTDPNNKKKAKGIGEPSMYDDLEV